MLTAILSRDSLTDEQIFIFVTLMFGVSFFIYVAGYWVYRINQNRKAKSDLAKNLECKNAVLISKVSPKQPIFNAHCDLTFEFDTGERKTFFATNNEVTHLFVGDKGELKYRGDTFVNFTRSISNNNK